MGKGAGDYLYAESDYSCRLFLLFWPMVVEVVVVCEFVMLVVLVILATAGGCNIKPAYGWPGQKVM